MGLARGDAAGMGTAPAQCSPTLCHAPVPQPRCRGQRCSCNLGGSMAPAAARMALLPGRRVGSHGETAQEQPGTGTGESGRAGDVQPSQGMGQASRPATGISPAPGWLGSALLAVGTGSTGGPRSHPAILPSSARQLEGSAAGERLGREMQQSRAGKERDAGGGGGTPAPAPLAVATATPAVCPGQRGLERGVWGQRWAQARCHPCPCMPL